MSKLEDRTLRPGDVDPSLLSQTTEEKCPKATFQPVPE